jgi:hypothetical protein
MLYVNRNGRIVGRDAGYRNLSDANWRFRRLVFSFAPQENLRRRKQFMKLCPTTATGKSGRCPSQKKCAENYRVWRVRSRGKSDGLFCQGYGDWRVLQGEEALRLATCFAQSREIGLHLAIGGE